METTRYKGMTCPSCGKHNDAASDMGDKKEPGEGDISLCFTCGHVLVFFKDARGELAVRTPTTEEQKEFDADPEIARARFLITMFHGNRPIV